MKKNKNIKIKYEYINPKTPEEKARQQEVIDDAFNILFDEVAKEFVKNKASK